MNRREAIILREYILQSYHTEDSFLQSLTDMLKVKAIEDWALTVEELMEMPAEPEFCFMRQIEKIATLLGCSPGDSRMVAVQSFAEVVIKNKNKFGEDNNELKTNS